MAGEHHAPRALAVSLTMSPSQLAAAWNRLWFAPVDARSLGVMRITLGVLLLVFHLGLWPDLLLLSESGPTDLRALDEGWTDHRWSHLDGLSFQQLQWVHLLSTIPILCFTLGMGTRLTAILTVVILVGTWHKQPYFQNGGDRLLRIWAIYLTVVPSYAAMSVDAWLRARRQTFASCPLAPAVGHRLVQLQLLVMYTYTGIAKLPGDTWHGGTAIYYAMSDGSFARFPQLFDWLLAQGWFQAFTMVGTWTTLGWEIAFAPLVLWKRTRTFALVMGLALHAGIFFTMSVGVFSWASVWGYQAFLSHDWVSRRLGDR